MCRRLLLPLAALPLLHAAALADAVILKSGERIEGKIISETEDTVTIEFAVARGIFDQRVYKRDEISKVEKQSAEDIAWQQIQDVKPGPVSKTTAAYDALIDRLQGFLKTYPESLHEAVVQERIDTFKRARERGEKGEIKIDFKWLSPAEVEKERYQIASRLLFEQMKELSARGDLVGALNAFATIEKEYPGSRAYPDAAALAVQVVAVLQADLAHREAQLKAAMAERDKGIAMAVEPAKSQLLAAVRAEEVQAKAVLADVAKHGVKWPPIIPRSADSLQALAAVAQPERTRLAQIDTAKMTESIQHVDAALKAMRAKDYNTAETELSQATSLWSQNEAAQSSKKRLSELKAAATAPTPTASPSPAPASRATATLAREAAPTPTPEAAATPASTPEATTAATPAPAAEETPAAHPKKKSFFFTIPGALLLVVVALILTVIAAVVERFQRPPDHEKQSPEDQANSAE